MTTNPLQVHQAMRDTIKIFSDTIHVYKSKNPERFEKLKNITASSDWKTEESQKLIEEIFKEAEKLFNDTIPYTYKPPKNTFLEDK